MSTKRVMHAVERAVEEVGGKIKWLGGTRHRNFVITLPNKNEIRSGISYGMHFDEVRTYKLFKGLIKKAMRND